MKEKVSLKQIKLTAFMSDFRGIESSGKMYAHMSKGWITFLARSKVKLFSFSRVLHLSKDMGEFIEAVSRTNSHVIGPSCCGLRTDTSQDPDSVVRSIEVKIAIRSLI